MADIKFSVDQIPKIKLGQDLDQWETIFRAMLAVAGLENYIDEDVEEPATNREK